MIDETSNILIIHHVSILKIIKTISEGTKTILEIIKTISEEAKTILENI